ncbi:MAG: beta strand repeat-containing protein, partial [Stenotrophomonas sp.]
MSGSTRYGLYAQSAGSLISATDLDVFSSATGYAVYATNGGAVNLTGGSIVNRAAGSYGLYAAGGTITGNGLLVSLVPGSAGSGAVGTNSAGRVQLNNSVVYATASAGSAAYGVNATAGSQVILDGTSIYTGLKLDPATGQALDVNGNITRDPTQFVSAGINPSGVTNYAVYVSNSATAWINVDPATQAPTGQTSTIRLLGDNPTAGATAQSTGTLWIANTTIDSAGAANLTALGNAAVHATGMTLVGRGVGSMVSSNGLNASLALSSSKVTSLSAATGLTAVNSGVMNVTDTDVRILGAAAITNAAQSYGGGKLYMTDTRLVTSGSRAYGLYAWNTATAVVSLQGGYVYTGIRLNANGDPVDSLGNVTTDPAQFVASSSYGSYGAYAQLGNVYLNTDPLTGLPTSTATDIVVNGGLTGSATHALYASAAGASVLGANVDVSLLGTTSLTSTAIASRGAALRATAGGAVSLLGGGNQVTVNGNRSAGLYADGSGSSIRADNLGLQVSGTSGHGAYAQNAASIYLNVDPLTGIPTAGSGGQWTVAGVGLLSQAAGSQISAANLQIGTQASNNAASGNFVEANGAGLVASGGTINGDALVITSANTGTSQTTTAAGAYLNSGGQISLNNGQVNASGTNQVGVLIDGSASPGSSARYATSSSFQGTGLAIRATGATGAGLYAYNGGLASLLGGSVATTGAGSHALQVDGGVLDLQGEDILTQGANAYGLLVTGATGASAASLAGSYLHTEADGASAVVLRAANGTIAFNDSANRIETLGANAHAISVQGSGSSMLLNGAAGGFLPSTVRVSGAGAAVLDAQGGGRITLGGANALGAAMTQGVDTWGARAETASRIDFVDQADSGGSGLWAAGTGELHLAGNATAAGSRVRL